MSGRFHYSRPLSHFFVRKKRTLFFLPSSSRLVAAQRTGIYPILEFNRMLPGFKGLRFDEALLLADFGLAVLAGLGRSISGDVSLDTVKTERLTRKHDGPPLATSDYIIKARRSSAE
jgi:hypothetical protein